MKTFEDFYWVIRSLDGTEHALPAITKNGDCLVGIPLSSKKEKLAMRFVIYKDQRGEWRWRLRARNGKIIADSAEGYKQKNQVIKRIQGMHDAFNRSPLRWTEFLP